MASDNSTSIVEAKTEARLARIAGGDPMALLMTRLRIMWCNVPFDSLEAASLLRSIVAAPTIVGDDRINVVFRVVAALVQHPSEHTTETGEVWMAPVTTLLTEDGETFRWASSGVADCLAVLTMARPEGRWNPPVEMRCVSIPTKKGFRRMTLQPVANSIPPTPKKGGNGAGK